MQNEKRINKNFSLEAEPGKASDKMVDILLGMKRRHGMAMIRMRNWMTAGYLLDEFGHGIIEYLLSTDDQRSPTERLQALVKYIERCEVNDIAIKPAMQPAVQSPVPAFQEPIRQQAQPDAPVTPTKKPGRLGQ